MDLKCSNSALGQDVDALILDYFMDDAIKALLREHTRDHTTQRDFSADGPLILVNRKFFSLYLYSLLPCQITERQHD